MEELENNKSANSAITEYIKAGKYGWAYKALGLSCFVFLVWQDKIVLPSWGHFWFVIFIAIAYNTVIDCFVGNFHNG